MGIFDGVLLASDFDDSLRSERAEAIPPKNLEAIRDFTAEGGTFLLATGRDLCGYRQIAGLLPPCYAVLSNGAVLYDGHAGTLLQEFPLPEDCRVALSQWRERFPDASFEIHCREKVYPVRTNGAVVSHLNKLGVPIPTEEQDEIPLPWTKIALLVEPILGVNLRAREICSEIRAAYPAYEPAVCGGIVDVSAAGLTKGTGVTAMARQLGIAPEHIYALGDSFNDLPMLYTAKIGFVPEDGVPEVAADPRLCRVGPCTRHALFDVVEILRKRYSHYSTADGK